MDQDLKREDMMDSNGLVDCLNILIVPDPSGNLQYISNILIIALSITYHLCNILIIYLNKHNLLPSKSQKLTYPEESLKVFRLKVAILSLKFVNSVMFNSSLLNKTCLNVYRPTSAKLSFPGTSCKTPVKANNIQCIRTLCQTKLNSAEQCRLGKHRNDYQNLK